MKRSSFFILFCLLACLSFAQTVKILFVGNSLTYTNNLPELVEKEAKSRGIKVKTTSLTFPNYAIVDHWDDGELQKHIMGKSYDFVIAQQGPSSQAEGRRMLIEDGRKLKKLCDKYETKFVYFMVWPSQAYYHTFDAVIKNHRDAATENGAILCPVGEAWKAYFDGTKDFSLYGMDGFHPSPKGSRLAAEVIVDTLFKNE
ncbi:SGNH/GDSL hydrolase family protein [Ekhidna sp.]|uniref:SGNH/GDSL hydrolase family protein n=1 Tax=Ekhidna sp. TaxID=2608089 RepID=UPI0032ED6D35